MGVCVAEIFNERPKQWGYRGDPYLWDDLEKYFSNFPIPYPEEEFIKEMYVMFEKLTGSKIDSEGNIHIEKYSHGGMSSGMVCQEVWLHELLPLLLERLHVLNRTK